MKYNPMIVAAYFKSEGIPRPLFEYKFHPERKWRFDICWVDSTVDEEINPGKLAIEVQGGIFVRGRHNRGAAMLKEWEKLNMAAIAGWRILYFQPSEICMQSTADIIKAALGIRGL